MNSLALLSAGDEVRRSSKHPGTVSLDHLADCRRCASGDYLRGVWRDPVKFLAVFLVLVSTSFAQATDVSRGNDLLKRALAEFKATPNSTVVYGGRDTPESVQIRELQDKIVTLQKRAALIAEIEQYLRDLDLATQAIAPQGRARIIP